MNHYQTKAAKQTLADHRPAHRKCLGLECEVWFWSLGPANRFCPKCVVASRNALRSKREDEGPLTSGLK